MKILVVEDNKEEIKKIEGILKQRHITFVIVSTYNDALEALGSGYLNIKADLDFGGGMPKNDFDGILTDMNFPRHSEEGTKPLPFGITLYLSATKFLNMPCVICTDQNRHADNGWTEETCGALDMYEKAQINTNKEWDKALSSLFKLCEK